MPTYQTPGVYIEEQPSGSQSISAGATAVAAFVGFTETFPTDNPADPDGVQPRLVTSWTDYTDNYGGFIDGAMLPIAVKGYFDNGGVMAYIVRIPNAAPAEEPSMLALPASDNALGKPLTLTSIEHNANITVTVEADDSDGDDAGDGGGEPTFTLTVASNGSPAEVFPNLSFSGANKVDDIVNKKSTMIKVQTDLADGVDLSSLLATAVRPGMYSLEKPAPLPVPVSGKSFAGSETARTGINGLSINEDVTMVLIPDLITVAKKEDGSVDLATWKNVQNALITHCELQANRMAVLDTPPGMKPQELAAWRTDAMYDSAFAAMYYPWVRVENPVEGASGEILVPPSGHVAGLWARVDETRGVWKAPANEVVQNIGGLERNVSKAEQSILNPIGVNCIRPFGTRGVRVWGARTLSSNTDWRYINVRRLFNMVETAIMDGTQWVVFEPNDEKLWSGVDRTVSTFLRGLWRDGALFGATAEQAFFVRCDHELNPPESIEEGKLVVEVGIAPVRPAEFVIFRISQYKELAAA